LIDIGFRDSSQETFSQAISHRRYRGFRISRRLAAKRGCGEMPRRSQLSVDVIDGIFDRAHEQGGFLLI